MKKQSQFVKLLSWAVLVVGIISTARITRGDVVYNNSTTQIFDFAESGYEFGDDVALAGGVGRFITNFTLQYFGSNFSGGEQMCLRLYRNDGAAYGTNYNAPGTMLYDSGFFPIIETNGATLVFNESNSGFAVPVPASFTWTVEFSGVSNGAVAGLAIYDPPTVGSSFDQYWEHSGTNADWVYRDAAGTNINFGAIIYATPVASDVTSPSVSVVSPANKAKFFAGNYSPTVSGTANDETKLGLVLFKLNNGNFKPATTANGWSNWTGVSSWALGANTFYVKSVDAAGNESATTVNQYILRVTNALTVNISQPGGTANSTKSITTGSLLEVGKNYTLTAVPDSKSIFNNWSSPSGGYGYPFARYKFVMTNNLVLTANFVTNRFYDSEGWYYGLFNAGAITHSNAGFVKIKVKARPSKTATFSGTIYVDGNSKGFAGSFQLDGSGQVTRQIDRSKWSQKQPLWVRLQLPLDGSDTISGSISNLGGYWVSTLTGNRAITTNIYSGKFTMVLPGDLMNSTTVPGGDGYGLVNIDSSGVIKLAGSKLADGQNFSQKVSVSKNGVWPLYSRANSAGGGQFNGMILGWVGVTNGITGNLTWIKTANSGGTKYPAGFTVDTEIASSPYFPTDPMTMPIMTLGNDLASFDDGVHAVLTNSVTLSIINSKNKFTSDKVRKLALTLTPKTGKFTITFENPYDSNQKSKGFGVVLTNQSIGRGYALPAGNAYSGGFLLE